jgi:hydroxymethylglutaryl-CoA synthase
VLQEALGFCTSCEDAVSMGLTAFHNMVEKYRLNPRQIGRCSHG